MKKLMLIATALTATLLVNAQTDKEPYMTKSLSGQSINAARVETSGGSILVNGVPNSEARVEVYIRASNSKYNYTKDEIAKKLEDEYELKVEVQGSQVVAIAKNKKLVNFNWNKALSISFKVYIPVNSSTDLSTSGGSINLANLNGKHDFRTSGGSLHIDKLSGNIKGRTSGGSISIAQSKADDIDLHTSGGSITADNCTGKMELHTSGGSLTLNTLQGNVDAKTSGGSVHADNVKGDLVAHTSGGNVNLKNLSGSVDASTSGGGVHVELTQLGDFVKISNSGGNVDVTLPGDKGLDLKIRGDRIHTSTLKNFSGKMEEDEVDGKVNGGGVPVTIRSSSGRINLTMK